MLDHGIGYGLPRRAVPAVPSALFLIEDLERLVAELRELRPPAGAALDGAVVEDLADDANLLAAVHLVPDRLQHLPEERRVAILAVHQAAHVAKAHVAAPELLVRERTDAARARVRVSLEREVHL